MSCTQRTLMNGKRSGNQRLSLVISSFSVIDCNQIMYNHSHLRMIATRSAFADTQCPEVEFFRLGKLTLSLVDLRQQAQCGCDCWMIDSQPLLLNAQRLFAEPLRAFSHGCIRVSDPVALATEVLRGAPGEWTPEKIRAAMDGDSTFRVMLAHSVHVLILYGTAVATEDGAVHFLNDIYGQDRRLETLLGLEPITPGP